MTCFSKGSKKKWCGGGKSAQTSLTTAVPEMYRYQLSSFVTVNWKIRSSTVAAAHLQVGVHLSMDRHRQLASYNKVVAGTPSLGATVAPKTFSES